MLRAIGAALIATGLAGVGFACALHAQRRMRALQEALRAVSLLHSQVVHLMQPLCDAVQALAPQNAVLRALRDAGCPLDGEEARAALRRAGLGDPERGCMAALLSEIPQLAAGQTGPFDSAAEQLSALLTQRRQAAEQAASLYPRLGLLAAIAALVLLI